MRLKKGFLIVLEGIDGAGKSTQARRLLRRLKALGYEAVSFREPTRGKWGRAIKRMAKTAGSLTPEEELKLFVKDRQENVRRNIRPALSGKKLVILDRYYFSTIAYQGAKGIDPDHIRRLNERFAVKPDLVFILDIEAGRGLGRIKNRKRKDLLFERERYLARVRRIFRSFRGRKFIHLDARRPPEELSEEIAARVLRLIQKHTR
ncbi:MAG TPA: dTMP kinase [Candidatus Aminicenantes bacterium]|nr:dTMP kinase [Candidatus Aminicenantes bacterium]